MSNKLRKTRNNLKLILSSKDKPKTREDLDREADLTLLSVTIDMQPGELSEFLKQYAIDQGEYNYLKQKYSRIIKRYKQEQQDANSSTNI